MMIFAHASCVARSSSGRPARLTGGPSPTRTSSQRSRQRTASARPGRRAGPWSASVRVRRGPRGQSTARRGCLPRSPPRASAGRARRRRARARPALERGPQRVLGHAPVGEHDASPRRGAARCGRRRRGAGRSPVRATARCGARIAHAGARPAARDRGCAGTGAASSPGTAAAARERDLEPGAASTSAASRPSQPPPQSATSTGPRPPRVGDRLPRLARARAGAARRSGGAYGRAPVASTTTSRPRRPPRRASVPRRTSTPAARVRRRRAGLPALPRLARAPARGPPAANWPPSRARPLEQRDVVAVRGGLERRRDRRPGPRRSPARAPRAGRGDGRGSVRSRPVRGFTTQAIGSPAW